MEASETIEKPEKRTYQKHKTEKKVSIVHFINHQLKPKKNTNDIYPIYLRITVKRQTTNIKSLLDCLNLTISEFEHRSEDSIINDIINEEINLIQRYVNESSIAEKEDFKIREISLIHNLFIESVSYFYSNAFKKGIRNFIHSKVSELGIREEFYELFFFENSFTKLNFDDFLGEKFGSIVSILTKIFPEYEFEKIDNAAILLSGIKIFSPTYGVVIRDKDDF